ncbi:MAG: hypothetical protein U1A78_33775 [Polyangia bacterium]
MQRAVQKIDSHLNKLERKAQGATSSALSATALYQASLAALADQAGAVRLVAYAGTSSLAGVALHTVNRKVYTWLANAQPADEAKGFFRRPSTHVAAIDMATGIGLMTTGALIHSSKRKAQPDSDPYVSAGMVFTGSNMLTFGLNTLVERYL